MKENEEKKIPYQFTANPLNLMFILDSDCLKMLNLLIQEESFWGSQGQLVDGYFFKSINELKSDMFMANDQDVRLTIEALYTNGIIDVINQGDKHKASRFKINQEKIKEIDSKSILEVKKFCPLIRKLKRGSLCSYMEKTTCPLAENTEVDDTIPDSVQVPGSGTNCTTDCHTNCTTDCNPDCSPTCTPKLDKSNLLNKSYSLNKIDDNIINNNIINNEVIEEESFHLLNIEIGDKGKGFVDINDQEVINASVTSQTDANSIVSMDRKEQDTSIGKGSFHSLDSSIGYTDKEKINIQQVTDASAPSQAAVQHIEPSSLEDRLNDYFDNRPEKVSLAMRVMNINGHFRPDEYQAIDTIVRRKDYKHYDDRDNIMMYLKG